jgi:FMN-dependent NADH-azoreductase
MPTFLNKYSKKETIMNTNILYISSSTRGAASMTDQLAEELLDQLAGDDTVVVRRTLTRDIPLLSPAVTSELTVPVGERGEGAAADLAIADALIRELADADVVVIGAPIYNFGVPASLKAWADLVARAGTTFTYAETGPVGLLDDRPTFIVSASGGTEIGGDIDYATRWLRHFLGFIGLHDVTVVAANQLAIDPEAGLASARAHIADIGSLATAA